MGILNIVLKPLIGLVGALNGLLWGDLIVFGFGEIRIGLSLIVIILLPAGIYFTIKTRFLPFRLFPEMIRVVLEPKASTDKESISGVQALFIATASRVGMGNLAGVVAAISFGGPGAVFWMWIVALLGSASAFIESTLAQIYKEKDPIYGGYRGGPAYFMDRMEMVTLIKEEDIFVESEENDSDLKNKTGLHYTKGANFKILGILFALSGLICWAGISQIVANSVTQSFTNAFQIPPLYTSIVLVFLSAIVLFKKGGTVDVLNRVVPIMAGFYLMITLFIIFKNIGLIPNMFKDIVSQAFGIKQFAAGGFGAVLMNGVKRGL